MKAKKLIRLVGALLVLCLVTTELPGILADASDVFVDVRSGDYFYSAVLWAVNANPQITAGTSATTFSPNGKCTRGQVVTFLWRAYGKPEVTVNSPFSDVSAGKYYYEAVLWAVQNGITYGTSANTFSPNAICNRGQVVTFLWRTAGKPAPKSMETGFSDVLSSDYFATAVAWAFENGITKGVSSTSFGPNQICRRGQVVVFLYRAREIFEEGNGMHFDDPSNPVKPVVPLPEVSPEETRIDDGTWIP